MKYHVSHITLNGQAYGLNAYQEVVESVVWGLRELGHTVESGIDTFSESATNIIFGAQVLEMDVVSKLPPSTIVYNFEQIRGATLLRPPLVYAAENFKIWDYSEGNADVWKNLNADCRIVPVGYAEPLTRIPKASIQDIDVLMYGAPGPDRLDAFHHLCHFGLKTVFVCGLYGKARDELIARSKLIVNINLYTAKKIFEVVRVSYLLANRKAVVADIDPETCIDEDISAAICVAAPSALVEECHDIVNDENRRKALEESGFEIFRNRDIRPILEAALAA